MLDLDLDLLAVHFVIRFECVSFLLISGFFRLKFYFSFPPSIHGRKGKFGLNRIELGRKRKGKYGQEGC